MRALKIAGAAVIGLTAVATVLPATGIPSSFATWLVQDRIERATGYRIAIAGKTTIGVWPSLSLALHKVTLDKSGKEGTGAHLAAGEVRAELPFANLLSGSPKISELTVDHPTLRLPMRRERTRATVSSPAVRDDTPADGAAALPIDRVIVSNGTLVFFDPQRRTEDRVGDLNATVAIGADRKIVFTGDARPNDRLLKFALTATPPAGNLGRRNIPTELTLDISGAPIRKLTAKANVRLNGQVVLIDGLSGLLDDGKFNGWASVDLASKPLVKVNLDFQQLRMDAASAKPGPDPAPQPALQPWSDVPFDIGGLNYVDAEVTISAAELICHDTRFAPAAVHTTIASGVLNATFSRLGAYGGEVDGTLSIDASNSNPSYALRADVISVRALPLLSSLADFNSVDGKMQAKADVQATGTSLRAIMSSLGGTASVDVRDGAIRNLNIAKMIRALTSGALSGWQERPDQATDLSRLSATATIARGQATAGDLYLVGPLVRMTGAGTVDIGSKTLAFRVEPKLVMTTEGQGSSADPVGLGIPVIVQGTWNEPSIYPDVAGFLDNPNAAYAKLRELGQGLFGQSGTGPADKSGASLGETLGTMIQQGLGGGAGGRPSPGGQPSQVQPPQGQPSSFDDIVKRLLGR